MKIGIDVHGVITANPDFFSKFSKLLVCNGHEVHIMSGARYNKIIPILQKYNISYTHIFSISDSEEKKAKTIINWDEKNEAHMDQEVWDKAKSIYAEEHNLDFHIDDTMQYGEYFKTPFALYKHDFKKGE